MTALVVVRAMGLVTVQGRGRDGHMHEALPRGGPLVPLFARRANRAVSNVEDATTLEVCGRIVLRADGDVHIATERRDVQLRDGEELEIASEPARVTYVAVGGGIVAPRVLGDTSTHLSAGIGALVRAGDPLGAGNARGESTRDEHLPRGDIRIVPGPDGDAFEPGALEAFCAATWKVSPASNRVGTRLDGGSVARRASYTERSRPMVAGAIEVPRDGAPIVLGPEHPTTGGYPVLAVVADGWLDALHAIGLGRDVRFRV